ncbi:MAG: hypothetical protein WC979_01700 [Candidatus Pacearchaeota archaeon]|jgi:hypothetical protein|nr:hypothetical protein [Clostridia bacterium]
MNKRIPTFDEFLLMESPEADAIYDNSLEDAYWEDIATKFPNYNNPNSYDCGEATEYILNKMKEEYDNVEWDKYEDEIRTKIKEGLT